MKVNIQGQVTISLSDFESLLIYRKKWENALKTADDLKSLIEEIEKNDYHINGIDLTQRLEFIEARLRRGC